MRTQQLCVRRHKTCHLSHTGLRHRSATGQQERILDTIGHLMGPERAVQRVKAFRFVEQLTQFLVLGPRCLLAL